jgi:hypothetical protein
VAKKKKKILEVKRGMKQIKKRKMKEKIKKKMAVISSTIKKTLLK